MGFVRKSVRAMVHLTNGHELNGVLIIDRDTRLSDVMNNLKKEFIVLLDEGSVPHIVNKHHIIELIEIEEPEIDSMIADK